MTLLTKYDKEFIKTYYKAGIKILCQVLNRPAGTIRNIYKQNSLSTNDIKLYTTAELSELYKPFTIDFTITNYPKELAYFLGYFWADGYIKCNSLVLEITKADGLVIKHILDKIGLFSISYRNRPNRKPQMNYCIVSEQAAAKLKSLGKYSKSSESYQKIYEYVPEDYRLYFLRGLLDGDGCFYVHNEVFQIIIASNYNQDWDYLKQVFINYGMKTTHVKQEICKSNKSSCLRSANATYNKIFINKLYKNQDGIYLPRKFNKIKCFLNETV